MGDPIGAISGVAGLLVIATQLSVGISRRVDAVRGLPKTLQALSTDLKGFVSVLGTLQGYLDHEDTREGVLYPGTVDELSEVLKDCIQVFNDLNSQLNKDFNGLLDAKMSTWKRLRLSFREKDFDEVREKLAARKMTLAVAVSVANFINTSSHIGTSSQMKSDLSAMKAEVSLVLQRLETMQADASPGTIGVANDPSGLQRLLVMRRRSGSHKITGRSGSRQGQLISGAASVSSSIVSFHTAVSVVIQTAEGMPTSRYIPAGSILAELDNESTYEMYDPFTRLKKPKEDQAIASDDRMLVAPLSTSPYVRDDSRC